MEDLRWIEIGHDPLRVEYCTGTSPVTGQTLNTVGYVEREPSGYFRWETYTNPHRKGACSSMQEAKARVEFWRDPGELEE